MDASKKDVTRRSVLKTFGLWVATGVIGARTAWATKKEKKPIDEKNPGARALGYAHQAKSADASKGQIKNYQAAGENCSKCLFFTAGSDPKWGDCKLITQGLVSAEGLCMSFAKKA